MKAVFVKQDVLLERPAEGEPPADQAPVRPGVAQGLSDLAAHKLFVVVLDVGSCALLPEAMPAPFEAVTKRMLDAIRQDGGRVDALLQCPHDPGAGCGCWSTYPGFLYAAAAQLDLRLDECFLLCDEAVDALLAYKVGCRPILVLDGREIADLYDGHQPEPRDFPIARDFASAVHYVLCEEEAAQQWGHARQTTTLQLEEEGVVVAEIPEFSPTLKLLSPVPGLRGALLPLLPQVNRRARQWLVAFIAGAVWLALGIAYLLTHLYRVQPFPEFVYYLTLQFIPRPVRAALFILSGVLVVGVSLRAFLNLFPANGRRK